MSAHTAVDHDRRTAADQLAASGVPVICPSSSSRPDGTAHTVVGCGSTHTERDDSEDSLWDCLDCGIFFDPFAE